MAIFDDRGPVHQELSESDTLVAYALLTQPDKVRSALPAEYDDLLNKYHKETTGKIYLVKILKEYEFEKSVKSSDMLDHGAY